jgi:hypothetical protein
MKFLLFPMVAAACLASSEVSAQVPVYRCGSEYSFAPCTGARLIDVSDPVTAERTAQAREAARREALLGEAMARDRRAEAAAFHPAMAANIGPAPRTVATAEPVKKKAKAKVRKKPSKTSIDGDFVAKAPKAKAAAS